MISSNDLKDLICIHRKHFTNVGIPDEGTMVSIYYKYNSEKTKLNIFDYSIQFIVNNKPGINVANQPSIVPNELYDYFFKKTYEELHDYVLTQIK